MDVLMQDLDRAITLISEIEIQNTAIGQAQQEAFGVLVEATRSQYRIIRELRHDRLTIRARLAAILAAAPTAPITRASLNFERERDINNAMDSLHALAREIAAGPVDADGPT